MVDQTDLIQLIKSISDNKGSLMTRFIQVQGDQTILTKIGRKWSLKTWFNNIGRDEFGINIGFDNGYYSVYGDRLYKDGEKYIMLELAMISNCKDYALHDPVTNKNIIIRIPFRSQWLQYIEIPRFF